MTANDRADQTADPSRRAVVRVAAGSAWTVPVVVAASAAPAMAASGGTGPAALRLTLTDLVVEFDGTAFELTLPVTVVNTGGQATTALTYVVEVTLDAAERWGAAPTARFGGGVTPVAGQADSANDGRYRFSLTAAQQLGANQTSTPDFVIDTGSGVPVNFPAVTLTAIPGGAGAPTVVRYR